MQKKRRRGLSDTAENEGVGSLLAVFQAKIMLKNNIRKELKKVP
jgi:hypothetical protein